MKKMILLITCIAVALSVQARLCETEYKCAERYGQPVGEEAGMKMYQMGPYRIGLRFERTRDGLTVDRMSVQKLVGGEVVRLSAHEIKTILDANKRRGRWIEVEEEISGSDWRVEKDGKRSAAWSIYRFKLSGDSGMAAYDSDSKTLVLTNKPDDPWPAELKKF